MNSLITVKWTEICSIRCVKKTYRPCLMMESYSLVYNSSGRLLNGKHGEWTRLGVNSEVYKLISEI